MSILKRGTRCVIVAGCPENIGLIVEVGNRLGRFEGRSDAYRIRTLSGRTFQQFWDDKALVRGFSSEAITDRHKLRPLIEPRDGQMIDDSTYTYLGNKRDSACSPAARLMNQLNPFCVSGAVEKSK